MRTACSTITLCPCCFIPLLWPGMPPALAAAFCWDSFVCVLTERSSRLMEVAHSSLSATFHSEHLSVWLFDVMSSFELVTLSWAYSFQLSDPTQASAVQGKACNTYSRWSCHISCEGHLIYCSCCRLNSAACHVQWLYYKLHRKLINVRCGQWRRKPDFMKL